MYALITGASSGIGRDIARELSDRGINLILVARDKDRLNKLAASLKTKVIVIPMDLSRRKSCIKLYYMLKDKPVDILVNNAGFGAFGEFEKTNLSTEINMVNLNICAVHILTKLFLRKMLRQNRGHILNVASLAAFTAGPLMSTYYATKSYVYSLTCAIAEELRRSGRNVHISAFCPGPVATEFNKRAGVSFSIKPISSELAAKRAVDGMLKGKTVIFPRFADGLTALAAEAVPAPIAAKVCYHIQKRKQKV